MRRLIIYGIGLFFWLPGNLNAQRVTYSESFNARPSVRYRIIGRSENFYWIEKQVKPRTNFRRNANEIQPQQSFGLYDLRLNLLKEIPAAPIPNSIKQWLVAGPMGLDQIVLTRSAGKIKILRSHFETVNNIPGQTETIDSLPFSSGPSRFILVRSEDQTKILLIGFENTDEELTRVHTLLFNMDWSPVYHQMIAHEQISQPCIQDEEIGFAAESFDNLPIKLANNGEWLMAYPSRTSRGFSLFHGCPDGIDYNFRDIPLSSYYRMEDIAMSINNDQQEMSLGFLSAFQRSHLKNVQVCNYSMSKGQFDFDSSYRFTTLAKDAGSNNLSHESFIAVPGGGYLLLKEYGFPFDNHNKQLPVINSWETAFLLADYSDSKTGKSHLNPGYTMNHGLSPIPYVRNRGDLNVFYFPAISKDSTWSGRIEMEQQAELNNPELSYLMIPRENKLYIIYNSLDGWVDPMATATTLNLKGQPTGEGLIFWEMKKMLNFQQSRRFSADEVAVPYKNKTGGFAILRL